MKSLSSILVFQLIFFALSAQNVGIGTENPSAKLHTKGDIAIVEAFEYDLENGQLPPGENSGDLPWFVDTNEGYKSSNSLSSPSLINGNFTAAYVIPYQVEKGRIVTFTYYLLKNDPNNKVQLTLMWDDDESIVAESNSDWTKFEHEFVSTVENGYLRIQVESREETNVQVKIDQMDMSYESGYALKIEDGTEQEGYFLQSDALGNTKWTDLRSDITNEIMDHYQNLTFDHQQHQMIIENGNRVNISGLRNEDFRRFYMSNDTLKATSGFSLQLPKNGPQQAGFFWDQKIGSLILGRDPSNGNNTIGSFSMRWGLSNEVTELSTTSFGQNNKSNAVGSVTWGNSNTALGVWGTAWGEDNNLSGILSTVWGKNNVTSDSLSTSWGSNNFAGKLSTTWGMNNSGNAVLSTSWGLDNLVSDSLGTAWGRGNTALKYATVFGVNNKAGQYSTCIGSQNYWIAGAEHNFIVGKENIEGGKNSIMLGWNNELYQESSILIGTGNNPNSNNSILIGDFLETNSGGNEISLGRYNYSTTGSSSQGLESDDHLLTVGNGNQLSRQNALSIYYDGQMRLGYDGPLISSDPVSTVEIAGKPSTNSSASLSVRSYNDSNSSMRFRSTASNTIEFNKSESDFRIIHHSTGNYLRFHDNNIIGSGEGLFIAEGNNVGINVSDPDFLLQLGSNSAAKPVSSAWTVASDRRLKKDVKPFKNGLETVLAIQPVWFTYNGKGGIEEQTGVGTIAQDLEKVAPYMIKEFSPRSRNEDGTSYKAVDYGSMDFVLVNAIKEQNQIILDQQVLIEEHQKIIKDLADRLTKLEAKSMEINN